MLIPTRRFLPCEKLYPGMSPIKGNDFFPCYVRLFAVLLYGGDNELMNTRRFSLWVSPCGKQAEFRVSPRPKSPTVKPCVGLFIEFQPYKGGGLIGKAPNLDKPQGFGKLGEYRPQRKVRCPPPQGQPREARKVPLCSWSGGGVLPRRKAASVRTSTGDRRDYAVFLFNGVSSLLSVCFLLSP